MDKVISIIGPRRAGKTYYFYQLLRENKESSLYLNFEDISFKEIRDLIRIYIEITSRTPNNLFFDEIQNVKNWEVALRELISSTL